MEKMASDGPKWAPDIFPLLIQTLPIFWAERIWILRIFVFFYFSDPKFLDFQVPRFPKSGPWPGLGHAWPIWTRSSTPPPWLRGGSWTTKCGRSKELGQYRENPISASPVWGRKTTIYWTKCLNKFIQTNTQAIDGKPENCGTNSPKRLKHTYIHVWTKL